jgi:hypothetical protein
MKRIIILVAAFFCMGMINQLSAQQGTPEVTNKQITQQARIQEGKKNGELTGKERARLQMQQAKILHDKKQAKSDGVVTAGERRKLRTEQRRASRTIYRQKHDAEKRN